MEQPFSDQLRSVERRLLPDILRDQHIRRNTFINRPKTNYDSYLRRKLTTKIHEQYLRNRHLLSVVRRKGGEPDAGRMPLPYRRFIVPTLRQPKIHLSGIRLRPGAARRGPVPVQPLSSILPEFYLRSRVTKPGQKREKYPKTRDPHNPVKAPAKPSKEKKKGKGEKKEEKPKAKPQKPAKKGKGTVRRGAPPKGTKEYTLWHSKRKQQKRKRKLRKWIILAEKRRRIKITQEILQEEQFKGKRGECMNSFVAMHPSEVFKQPAK